MIRYLLDTNACIALLNKSSRGLSARVRRNSVASIGVPSPVAFELCFGAFKSRDRDRNLGLLDEIAFETVPFEAGDAGAIRSELEPRGLPAPMAR